MLVVCASVCVVGTCSACASAVSLPASCDKTGFGASECAAASESKATAYADPPGLAKYTRCGRSSASPGVLYLGALASAMVCANMRRFCTGMVVRRVFLPTLGYL